MPRTPESPKAQVRNNLVPEWVTLSMNANDAATIEDEARKLNSCLLALYDNDDASPAQRLALSLADNAVRELSKLTDVLQQIMRSRKGA